MSAQQSALLHLLNDDDPATLRLVKAQLTEAGARRLPELEALIPNAPPVAARHLREIIANIEQHDAAAVFGRVCRTFGAKGDIEEAAWRLAAALAPGDCFDREKQQLEEWADEVRRRLTKAASDEDRIETLVEFLSDDAGLEGNHEDYYNINNSLLPEVIRTRRGIPISLSLVYLAVARRVGLDFAGVPLPGHFIVRSGSHFFDPFHRGRRLGIEDCRALVERTGQRLNPQHLQPASSSQILLRMLANLRALADDPDPPLAALISSWMGELESD